MHAKDGISQASLYMEYGKIEFGAEILLRIARQFGTSNGYLRRGQALTSRKRTSPREIPTDEGLPRTDVDQETESGVALAAAGGVR